MLETNVYSVLLFKILLFKRETLTKSSCPKLNGKYKKNRKGMDHPNYIQTVVWKSI